MSRLDIKTHMKLLKEARAYFKDVKPVEKFELEKKQEPIVLTQEHIAEWLEVFYEDRIRLDGCNFATVKR
ncbi:MAG: hypothetical protein U9Q40_00535 [Campylobacterota bacterium]|nr:hypothetical protein [Campylobacterota bacterium]